MFFNSTAHRDNPSSFGWWWFGFGVYYSAQQVGQRDAPTVGGFEVLVFYQGSVASLGFR
jgi:hypothetical protein